MWANKDTGERETQVRLNPLSLKGPSIKYVTLEGKGVREGVTVCDRGRGSRAYDVTLINIFYHTYET